MIARARFARLSIRQQVYKTAETIRELEKRLASGSAPDYAPFETYRGYLEENAREPMIGRALAVIRARLDGIKGETGARAGGTDIVRRLNFCFHELMELISEPDSESFYRPRYFDNQAGARRFPIAGILDDLRSAFNVGSIFRTSDALGVGGLALCGITPRPPAVKLLRTSMETVKHVDWEYYPETAEAIASYRNRGWKVYAVETLEGSRPVSEMEGAGNSAFVFGNEEFGLTDGVIRLCDGSFCIPQFGVKNSMNVAAAYGIVMYEAINRAAG